VLDYIAMGMVLHEPLTGYDIKKEIQAGVGNFYAASYGSLYPALKKLTDKGYLTVTEHAQGKRKKKYYEATELGKAAFIEWLSLPYDPNSSDPVVARIYFFGELPADIRKRQLQDYEQHQLQVLHKLEAMEKRFAISVPTDREYFELCTLYLGLQQVHDAVRWFRYINKRRPLPEFIRKDDEFERE